MTVAAASFDVGCYKWTFEPGEMFTRPGILVDAFPSPYPNEEVRHSKPANAAMNWEFLERQHATQMVAQIRASGMERHHELAWHYPTILHMGHIWMLMTGLISVCTPLPSTKAGPGWWLGGWVAWIRATEVLTTFLPCWWATECGSRSVYASSQTLWREDRSIHPLIYSLKISLRTILSWMQQMTAWQLLNIVRILQLASKCVMDCTTTCNLLSAEGHFVEGSAQSNGWRRVFCSLCVMKWYVII